MDITPEQQLGALAAEALDGISGRKLVGAVLLLTLEESEDMTASAWFVPDRQPWPLTLGMVEDWRVTRAALITSSAVATGAHEDPDEDDD